MLSLESEETGQTDLASHSIISYQSKNLNPQLFISCSSLDESPERHTEPRASP